MPAMIQPCTGTDQLGVSVNGIQSTDPPPDGSNPAPWQNDMLLWKWAVGSLPPYPDSPACLMPCSQD